MIDNRVPIDVLCHADFSGRIRKGKDCPGLAAFCAALDSVRDANRAGAVVLDAGDEFCASYWGGEPVVKALSLIGTEALTLGNHEFDRGREFLEACVMAAEYPILCANVVEKDTNALVRGAKPYVILEKAGLKIGVLGLTTEYTPYMVEKKAFLPYSVTSGLEACQTYIPQMRNEGAQIVIVLAHFPFYVDEDGISGELYELLSRCPPADVFIGGHIPGDYAGIVNGAVVLKAGFGGNSLGHARLWFDREQNRVTGAECDILLTDREAPGRPEIREYEKAVTQPFEAYFHEKLAFADEDWHMRLAAECKLGNFLADCMWEGAGVDIAYMNATTAGGTICAGPVTVEDITSVYGFRDNLMTAQMTGAQIYELLELVYAPGRFGNNAGLLYSGLIVHVDHTKPSPRKIQKITLRDGTPVEPGAVYTVATSEYMASGGNDTGQVALSLAWKDTGVPYLDAIFAYLRKYKTMRIQPERRLYEIGVPENNNAPF